MPDTSEKPLTVLQVLPSLEAGGAERATVDVAAALVRAGHRAFVISSGGRMVRELEEEGARHFAWPVHSKNPLVIMMNGWRLAKFIRQHGINVIHARSRAPAWSSWIAAKQTGIAFVTTYHAAYKSRSRMKTFYNSVMAKGQRIIAISQFIAEHLRRQYGQHQNRVVLVPRGIDFTVYDPAAISSTRKEKFLHEAGAPPGVPLILIPGRLSPIKGQDHTLRALARVKLPYFAVIVGPDQGRAEYSRSLHNLAQDLGIGDKTSFLTQADLPAAYSVSSLVISASQIPEGFGRVPVEAQAFGVPVIATLLGATSETVKTGQTGWLVPAGDVHTLAGTINDALSLEPDMRARMSEEAKAFVRSRFDLVTMCASTLKIYEEVVKGEKR